MGGVYYLVDSCVKDATNYLFVKTEQSIRFNELTVGIRKNWEDAVIAMKDRSLMTRTF